VLLPGGLGAERGARRLSRLRGVRDTQIGGGLSRWLWAGTALPCLCPSGCLGPNQLNAARSEALSAVFMSLSVYLGKIKRRCGEEVACGYQCCSTDLKNTRHNFLLRYRGREGSVRLAAASGGCLAV